MDYLAKIAELEKENMGLRKKLEEIETKSSFQIALASELAGKAINIKQTVIAAKTSETLRQDGFYYKGESGLSAKEFVDRIKNDSNWSFHFKNSNDSRQSAKSDLSNPFSKSSFNLSEQMRLYRNNPELADRLKREAT